MTIYSPAWPHGDIEEVFENIYVVRGTNITHFEGATIQHSRNMTIVKEEGNLVLINTVRLDEKGLRQLDNLGVVKHVIRIGAFHGRDDAFYLDKYGADLWAYKSEQLPVCTNEMHYLTDTVQLPLKQGHFFTFPSSLYQEGFIYLEHNDGVLITCDSIKNWLEIDNFFSEETGKQALNSGEIAKARISPIWLHATGVKKRDFNQLLNLKFKHLISAHGDVLRNTAFEAIQSSVTHLE